MPQASLADKTIDYSDSGGSGTPVLLLHAFPLSSRMWEPQVGSLGERFRFIAPDLTGFGRSSVDEDRNAYSMDAWADQAKALLDHLEIPRAVVVGLSMGGYVAFSFWRRHRSSVAGLVLADTRADADAPENIEKRSGQQETVSEQGTAPLIEALPGALLGSTTREKRADVVERVKALMDNPPEGFIGALEAMKQRVDSTGDLAGIDVPTLIIVGEEDTLTPPELSRTMHEHIKDSQLAVIPEAGHLSNLESPAAFNGALSDFLARF